MSLQINESSNFQINESSNFQIEIWHIKKVKVK